MSGSIPAYGPEEIPEIVRRARVAQSEWATSTFDERRAVLHALIDEILKNRDMICKLSIADSGKTYFEAMAGEVLISLEKARHLIRNGEKALVKSYLTLETRSPFSSAPFLCEDCPC